MEGKLEALTEAIGDHWDHRERLSVKDGIELLLERVVGKCHARFDGLCIVWVVVKGVAAGGTAVVIEDVFVDGFAKGCSDFTAENAPKNAA